MIIDESSPAGPAPASSTTPASPRPAPTPPLDASGRYLQALDPNDYQGIRQFYDTYGFVVVHVLSDDECQATVTDIWDEIERLSPTKKVERDDPATWTNENWPGMHRFGIITNMEGSYTERAFANRFHPNVFKAYRAVLGTEKLIVEANGRYGCLRPPLPSISDSSKWETLTDWLHWDCNPWLSQEWRTENHDNAQPFVQGVLNLRDAPVELGGFHCVPGFHKEIAQWARDHEVDVETSSTVQVPRDDVIRERIFQCPVRAGDLVIFDTRLPHGNHPNRSTSPHDLRMVQYLKMMPDGYPENEMVLHTRHVSAKGEIGSVMFQEFCPPERRRAFTPQQLRLLGLQPYRDPGTAVGTKNGGGPSGKCIVL